MLRFVSISIFPKSSQFIPLKQVVLALAVAVAAAAPGYVGGAGIIAGPGLASPVLASRSFGYG